MPYEWFLDLAVFVQSFPFSLPFPHRRAEKLGINDAKLIEIQFASEI